MMGRSPAEVGDIIDSQVAFRQAQVEQILSFYSKQYVGPRCLVAYGLEDVDKLETINYVLGREQLENVVVNCKECLSQRHLLTKIFARCLTKLDKNDLLRKCDRLDNINALAGNLRKLFQDRETPFILVLVNADQQRGAAVTLLPALARLGDLVPQLSLIFTTASPHPLALHKAGVPYVQFPPYQRDEAIQILLNDPPSLLPQTLPDSAANVTQDKVRAIFSQFATVIYDTLISPTTSSILKYRQTCEKLWPRFIWPVVSGERLPGKSAGLEWDFARLLARNRVLFQTDGEEALQESLAPTSVQPCTFNELITHQIRLQEESTGLARSVINESHDTKVQHDSPLLKYLATLLLLAAYLASHTHPRHDIVLFSRLSNASSTNRRKKKYLARSRAGGITKTPTKSPAKTSQPADFDDDDDEPATPSKQRKSSKAVGAETATPKKERADRSMRAIFEKTSNIARPFTLERVIAVLRAIHPDGVKAGRGIADRIYAELGELERLRLVVRADSRAAAKGDAEDIVEEKWKCIVGRDWVVEAGKSWGLSIEGWEVE